MMLKRMKKEYILIMMLKRMKKEYILIIPISVIIYNQPNIFSSKSFRLSVSLLLAKHISVHKFFELKPQGNDSQISITCLFFLLGQSFGM